MQDSLTRRAFNRSFLLLTGSLCLSSKAFGKSVQLPKVGIQSNLGNAPQIHAAGGQFVGLSVADFLDPFSKEEEFAEKLETLSHSPIPIYTCNSFIRANHLHCTGPEANHDEVVEYCEIAFDRAKRANVTNITFGSSGARRIPDGFEYEKAIEQFVSLLKRLGPLAAARGVTVSVEQLRTQECNFINHITEVERVVRAADHPNIRGVADFYHMAAEGDTPEQLAAAADIVHHVEIAELEGRRVPGTSGQDFRPLLGVLKKAGYQGAIGIEGNWELSEMEAAFKEIKKQWTEA
ncbi:sugar phosphate isomerase/epimerase family protein [Pelagicoccus sp. SDUM812002]|uniref:sugar phosphate isomerase/epimerase family protein n=1 Tax=Pelagicoccus sp. SDUM812002 TaxID=3041266 RepID=UPI00280FF980|nr:sugar phosphate isomerase/epimerase family protein [Pelagicoccus sp. SDUM812002]MDQ8187969.1 sugar phosphate isomerase/epimerase [Pelagicoccus sp. SDUM812002]